MFQHTSIALGPCLAHLDHRLGQLVHASPQERTCLSLDERRQFELLGVDLAGCGEPPVRSGTDDHLQAGDCSAVL
ncbi:hypothetical protein D3C86_1968390 [compost metagenome]